MVFQKMWGEENYNCFDAEGILLNYGPVSKKRWGFGIDGGIVFVKDFHADFFIPELDIEKEAENGYSYLLNEKNFKHFLSEIANSTKNIVKVRKKLAKMDLSKLSNHDLFDIYGLFWLWLGKVFGCYNISQPQRIRKLEEDLLGYLEKRGITDASHKLSILTSPRTRFIFSNKDSLLFRSFSETLKHEDSKIDLSLIEKEDYHEEKADQKQRNKLVSELKLPKIYLRISEILRRISEERLRMRFVWMKGLYYNDLFLVEFRKRFGISKKELRLYDSIDLENLVLHGIKVSKSVLSSREKGFVKILENGKIITLEGDRAVEFIKNTIKEDEKEIKELHGRIASKGMAIGKAVIFSYKLAENHSEKIRKMSKGEIVISEMTRPNIIEACRKAAAIVTDEGGVTSHAAIVARELGVPCIIGTKIATKVLHDGDLVEVDANKGIVRIIKKN